MKHYPFKVVNQDGKPAIQVKYRGEEKQFVSTIYKSISTPGTDLLFEPVLDS
jgi:hypothetical protein